MKSLIFALLLLNGCAAMAWKDPSSTEQMSKIKNYKVCQTDYDCRAEQYCGFVAVDTFAVCRD